jgi:anti-sigma-K factor RskA
MPWWDRDHRRWNKENEHMPISHLRGVVERDLYWQNPKKRRWARNKLRWHDNWRWVLATTLTVLALLVGIAAAVGTYLNIYLTHGR